MQWRGSTEHRPGDPLEKQDGGPVKAVGYCQSLPISDAASLIDLELPDPTPSGRDLLVQVKAVFYNVVKRKWRNW